MDRKGETLSQKLNRVKSEKRKELGVEESDEQVLAKPVKKKSRNAEDAGDPSSVWRQEQTDFRERNKRKDDAFAVIMAKKLTATAAKATSVLNNDWMCDYILENKCMPSPEESQKAKKDAKDAKKAAKERARLTKAAEKIAASDKPAAPTSRKVVKHVATKAAAAAGAAAGADAATALAVASVLSNEHINDAKAASRATKDGEEEDADGDPPSHDDE